MALQDNKLANCNGDNIFIWNIESGTVLYRLQEHTGSVNSLKLSQDGFTMASASSDATIKLIKQFKKEKKISIKIIRLKKNNGAGYAKNYGILLAKTKYVLVCDSDIS